MTDKPDKPFCVPIDIHGLGVRVWIGLVVIALVFELFSFRMLVASNMPAAMEQLLKNQQAMMTYEEHFRESTITWVSLTADLQDQMRATQEKARQIEERQKKQQADFDELSRVFRKLRAGYQKP